MNKCLTESDIETLAELHRQCLPESLVSQLGHRFARSFYRYIRRSEQELIVMHRQDEHIAGACVLSLSPSTLDRRLVFNSALLLSAVLRLHRLPLLKMCALERKSTSQGDSRRETLPEVILIFTAPEMRGKGIGLKLLTECERKLSSDGLDRYVVRTLAYPENRALDFYRSNGFIPKTQVDKHGKRYQVFEKLLSNSEQIDQGSGDEGQCS
jgi:GNAT superfamily N-acetyltransferase